MIGKRPARRINQSQRTPRNDTDNLIDKTLEFTGIQLWRSNLNQIHSVLNCNRYSISQKAKITSDDT